MPSSAAQRRTAMDRAVLIDVEWGADATPPFVPLWRRGLIRTGAIVLLVLLYSLALVYLGMML